MKRFILASLALFFVALAWNGLVHLVLLKGADAAVEGLFRDDLGERWWLSLLLTLGLVSLFVAGYARFSRSGTLGESVTFGLFFGLLVVLLVDVNQYLLYPLPASLVAKWSFFGLLEFLLYGLLVRWLYPVASESEA
ncbi:MAG: hypothetical protein K8J08_05530 [Thermoanaerobaculia bacterium]|nr:hypothetical protein [Thermoanaerobaculia bacterium]